MSLRDRLQAALKDAMKERQAARLSTLRLINAAIKDRDIASRGEGARVWSERPRSPRSWASW